MSKPEEWDRLVNSKWPKDMPIPSAQEAITGVKRLYRRAMGKPFKGKVVVTSGNRYTWIRRGVMYVNPEHGWNGFRGIIHLLAHYCHSRKNGGRPHSYKELEMEKDLTNYAIENGFHEGKLKSKPRAKKLKPNGLEIAQAGMLRWEAKLMRAETALKKYRKKVRYYEKRLSSEA